MTRRKFLVALTTTDNDYQREQAAAATAMARQLGVEVEIVYADNDAIRQNAQLMHAVEDAAARPHGILVEPVGGGLAQAAEAAIGAGIAWVVINRDVDYLGRLRQKTKAPVFMLGSDHEEVGRIQGRQMRALLPGGGRVLYIQGPSGNDAAQLRTTGMQQTKPGNIELRMLRGRWTEASATEAVASWLRLTTSRDTDLGAVVAQNDVMAIGARKAFEQVSVGRPDRDRLLKLPFTGVDGLQDTGRAWVQNGLLTATVYLPANTGKALEMLVRAMDNGAQPPERTLTAARSLPVLERLARTS